MTKIPRRLRYWSIQLTRSDKSIGFLLIGCTLLSLILTNISVGEKYVGFWENENANLHHIGLPASIQEWINDGLMAVFFLVAGMEIKKEILFGELSSLKKSILPVIAAIGGVLVPAIIFLLCNKGTVFQTGWGIPTATDIAFSIGIMSMLGRKYVPEPLKIFLTALAIMDDLIAILLVAFFYGGAIRWSWLGFAVICIGLLYLLFRRFPKLGFFHIAGGIVLWYCMFQSGIHATIAGVAFSLLIPVESMHSAEEILRKPVNFLIIPLFAIVNTCIPFNISLHTILHSSLFWGITLGLFVGKVTGISLFSWILIRLKWVVLPSKTNWKQFIGAGILAGIGFTMSIFIASLAFEPREWQEIAKLAILTGSFLSMIVGYLWLKLQ